MSFVELIASNVYADEGQCMHCVFYNINIMYIVITYQAGVNVDRLQVLLRYGFSIVLFGVDIPSNLFTWNRGPDGCNDSRQTAKRANTETHHST